MGYICFAPSGLGYVQCVELHVPPKEIDYVELTFQNSKFKILNS